MMRKTGKLPKGWQSVRLGEVCDLIRGVGFSGSEARYAPSAGYAPILRAGNIGDSLTLDDDLVWAPVENIADEQWLQVGDIVICLSSGSAQVVGKTARLEKPFAGSAGAFCGIIRGRRRDLVDTTLVSHWFRSPQFLRWRDSQARGANIQNLRFSQLALASIGLPSLAEQKRIKSFLNAKMAAIERARAAAAAQLEAAQALPAAYLREVFGSSEAQEWPRRTVYELCKRIDYGYTASAENAVKEPKFLRITDIQDGNVDWDSVPGCRISEKEEKANRLAHGDIVFARTGGTVGKSFLIQNPPRAVFASYLIRLKPNDQVVPEFLYHFLQSDGYWRQIRAGARGGAQPNVNARILGAIALPVPSLEKQQRIVESLAPRLETINQFSEMLQERLKTINALSAAYLRQAFTGEI